jgi:hypothetical protein
MIDPSDDARPLRIGPVIVVALGLLFAIAGLVAPSEETSDGGLRTPVWVPIPDWLTLATLAALAAASAIFIIIVRPWQRLRRQNQDDLQRYQEPGQRSRLMAALGFLLALTPLFLFIAAVFFFLTEPGNAILHRLASLADILPTSQMGPPRPASPITTGLIGTLRVLVGGGSLGMMIWLARIAYRRPPASGPGPHHTAFAAAVEDSLEDLQRETDPRAAIIRIYCNFERAVAAAEFPRRPWQTPIEFMRMVLGSFRLPAAPVADLTSLFELARFSCHAVGSKERETALNSLIEIRAMLADEERGPPGAV